MTASHTAAPAADGTWRQRLRRLTGRLQFRIVVTFLGLLLTVQLASVWMIDHRIEADARTAVDTELRDGQRLFMRLLQQRSASLQDGALLLAQDYGFRSAVASQDGETLNSALANQIDRIGADVGVFTDPQFRLKAATEAGAEHFLPSLRQLALDPSEQMRLSMLDGEAYLLAMVPVKAPQTIGWVGMMFHVEAPLLRQLRELASVDVALLGETATDAGVQWQLLQSTLGDAGNAALPAAWTAVHAAEPPQGPLRLVLPGKDGADDHVAARELSLSGHGQPQVLAVLTRSIDAASAPYRRLQWLVIGFTAMGVAVFALGSVVTAQRITTPLDLLTRSARKLARGDLDDPISVRSRDEIGELAAAFEAMRLAMQERDARVRQIAYEDPLTTLPNREGFRDALRSALLDTAARGQPCTVLMLDLDRFKHVNEVLGHRFGDAVLARVAQRLQHQASGPGELVARLGGDKFAVLLPGHAAVAGAVVAQRILAGFEVPITLDDHTVDMGAGIGLSSSPEHGSDSDVLIGHAEIAMYTAKQRQAGVVVYAPTLDANSVESLSLLSELRTAVDQHQLRLYLQPKISLATGLVVGAEALVRWQHPSKGLVPPFQFIPFAEQTGFIRTITAWVLRRCAQVLQQMQHCGIPLKLSVNLSTRDLVDQDLPDKLQRLLDQHGLGSSSLGLCLEITESAIMDDPQRALQTLERLHAMGLQLSIDDFGTGYSSLAYLKRLPVDELKIDQSFVLNMERDLDDAKIVKSTVDLAHNLGLRVVAEGVETAKAWALLQALGCDEAQGYFIARPMPEALFANWVQEWAAPGTAAERLDTMFSTLVDAD